jgi:hypothetical protein
MRTRINLTKASVVERVSNAVAQGTRWRATPNAHQRKDQTIKISLDEVASVFFSHLIQKRGV